MRHLRDLSLYNAILLVIYAFERPKSPSHAKRRACQSPKKTSVQHSTFGSNFPFRIRAYSDFARRAGPISFESTASKQHSLLRPSLDLPFFRLNLVHSLDGRGQTSRLRQNRKQQEQLWQLRSQLPRHVPSCNHPPRMVYPSFARLTPKVVASPC